MRRPGQLDYLRAEADAAARWAAFDPVLYGPRAERTAAALAVAERVAALTNHTAGREAIRKMTPAQINEAYERGQLAHLLSGRPEQPAAEGGSR